MTENSLTCQLCGSHDLERMEVPGSTVLYLCRPCELYQHGQMVGREAYEDSYHTGYDRHRAQKLKTARLRLNRIAHMIDPSIKSPQLLEIGCSVGATLEAAESRGWLAEGVDVSESAVANCRERGLAARVVGPFELPYNDDEFDVVCAWHVIEHVADVKETLVEWRRVLRPGGLLVIETPDANCRKARRLGPKYRKFWAPEHTYTFSTQSLSEFFERAGFEIEQPPVIGAWEGLSWGDRCHAVGYVGYHRMRQLIGVEKAFQLFGRRPKAQSGSNEATSFSTIRVASRAA